MLLILLMWLLARLTLTRKLESNARERAEQATAEHGDEGTTNWRQLIKSRQGCREVAQRYVMEWQMVWKGVTVGFTIAGVIAGFVPAAFFRTLFIGSGSDDPAFWQVRFTSFLPGFIYGT